MSEADAAEAGLFDGVHDFEACGVAQSGCSRPSPLRLKGGGSSVCHTPRRPRRLWGEGEMGLIAAPRTKGT